MNSTTADARAGFDSTFWKGAEAWLRGARRKPDRLFLIVCIITSGCMLQAVVRHQVNKTFQHLYDEYRVWAGLDPAIWAEKQSADGSLRVVETRGIVVAATGERVVFPGEFRVAGFAAGRNDLVGGSIKAEGQWHAAIFRIRPDHTVTVLRVPGTGLGVHGIEVLPGGYLKVALAKRDKTWTVRVLDQAPPD